MLQFIANELHYKQVLEKSLQVKKSLWIGTADIKDVYIKHKSQNATPYLGALSELIRKKVEIRLLFAKEPGVNFKTDFDKYPLLIKNLETAICPRVHFKIFIFDMQQAYIGSANLTGAGLGMKSANHRNFEAGILTDEPLLVNQATELFDSVWSGLHCGSCKRKDFCPLPIEQIC